jgi:hypothetical protein
MNIIKPIYVYKWVNSKVYIEYVFDTNENNSYNKSVKVIKEYIYQDSSKEDAINKIAYYINKDSKNSDDKIPYYVWVNNYPFLYELGTIIWKGYDVNPFKSSDRKSDEINEALQKNYNKSKELFNTNDIINIVFKNDFDYNNKYYYDNFKFKSNNYKLNSDSIITELYKLNIVNNKKISEEYYNVVFSAYIVDIPSLIIIFDKISATNKIQLIQYINNINKVYYKLFKEHSFKNRKELSRIFKLNNDGKESINIYYSKNIIITIYAGGNINLTFNYQIDKGVIINDILKYKNELNKYINDILNINIEFKEKHINARLTYNIDRTKYSDLKNELKTSTIFTEFNVEEFYYKRTSNYIDRSIIDKNIKGNVQNNNIKMNAKYDTDILDTKIIVKKKNGEYMFDIKYAKSFFEFECLEYWISKIIEKTIKSKQSSRDGRYSQDSHDSYDSPDIRRYASTSSETSGGNGDENEHYLINKLKNADKELWKDDNIIKNKARKCQRIKQPIPLSNEEFADFEKKGLNKNFDNSIKYNNNYYICPRLWCPKSNIPLPFEYEGDPNAKCPIADEKPMRLNEDMGNKNSPRYVGIIKKHNIPCCRKRINKDDNKKDNNKKDNNKKDDKKSDSTKQRTSRKSSRQDDVDKKGNNYIMKDFPINYNNRFGDIPKELYKILYPNNYNDYLKVCCSPNNINKKECILRKGLIDIGEIPNNYDNIINVIAYLVGKTRGTFIENIKNKIDIIKYLSLDNGNICKDFGDLEPVLYEYNKELYKELKKHLHNVNKKNNIYIDLPKFDSADEKAIFKISRLLYIFKSYKKFIAYISADNYPDDKGIQYLYSLVAIIYKKLLIVWEKTMDSTIIEPGINLLVPDYINEIISYYGLHNNTKIIMILKEKWKANGIKGENNKDRIYEIMKDRDDIYFYEPLIIKKINNEEKKHMTLNEYPNIKKIINYDHNKNIFSNLKNINNLIGKESFKYRIDTIIINDNYTIDKIMLKNNMLIRFNPQGIIILPYLIKELNIKNIVFLDDIVDIEYKLTIIINETYLDFQNKINKLKDFGITLDIGVKDISVNKNQDKKIMNNVLTIVNNDNLEGQVILFGKKNEYDEYDKKNTNDLNKWLELRLYVKNKLLIALDTKDKRIDMSRKTRAEFIENLLDMFDNNKRKIQIILEEIPIFTKEGINNWHASTLLHTKYDYINNLSDNFIDNGKELLFTQFLIKNKIPKNMLYYHETNPIIIYDKNDDNIINFDNIYDENNKKNISTSSPKISIKLPKMFKGDEKDLNSKWTKYKKKIWSKLKYIKNDYNASNIIELFDYFKSIDNDIVNDYNDIIKKTFKYYRHEFNKNIHNKTNIKRIKEIFKDPYFYSSYINAMNSINKTKKIFKTLEIFLTTYFYNSSNTERFKILNYIENSDDFIYHPNEITFRMISEVLNISILIIHNRADYGKAVNISKRADEKDLSITTTVYKAYNNELNRPLLMLYRKNDKTHLSYYIVHNINHNKIIYTELNELQGNDDDNDNDKKVNEIITIIQNTENSKSKSLSTSSSTQTINIL